MKRLMSAGKVKTAIAALCLVLAVLTATPALAATYGIDNASVTFDLPDGYNPVPYDITKHDMMMSTYKLRVEATDIAMNHRGAEQYVAQNEDDMTAVYVTSYGDGDTRRIWSLSDLPSEQLRGMFAGADAGALEISYHTSPGGVAFVKMARQAGGCALTSYICIENGHLLAFHVSVREARAEEGDALAQSIADSVVVQATVPGQMVAAWIAAIAVSVFLVVLYLKTRSKPAVVTRAEFDRMHGHGWMVLLLMVFLGIGITVALARAVAAASEPHAQIRNLIYLVVLAVLLYFLIRKDKKAIPLYIAIIAYNYCLGAATRSYEGMFLTVFDILFAVYLMRSKHVAVAFGSRPVEVQEPPQVPEEFR